VTSSSPSAARQPRYIVRPARRWRLPDLRELWQFRDLVAVLSWRDLKLRYSEAALGVAWVILQPLLGATILALIFGRLLGISGSRPYIVIVFSGFIFWTFFSSIVQRASTSIVLDARLVTKVYFPRAIVPLATIIPSLLDLVIGFVVVAVLMVYHGIVPDWRIVTLPLFLILGALSAIGVGLGLAALNVKYRDFMYAAPFVLQVWLYASPVVYESTAIPAQWRHLYALNPVAGFIDGCRWSLLGTPIDRTTVIVSIVMSALLFIAGVLVFHRTERSMADVI
jgi:lipopolysaccharide transport system permease protein